MPLAKPITAEKLFMDCQEVNDIVTESNHWDERWKELNTFIISLNMDTYYIQIVYIKYIIMFYMFCIHPYQNKILYEIFDCSRQVLKDANYFRTVSTLALSFRSFQNFEVLKTMKNWKVNFRKVSKFRQEAWQKVTCRSLECARVRKAQKHRRCCKARKSRTNAKNIESHNSFRNGRSFGRTGDTGWYIENPIISIAEIDLLEWFEHISSNQLSKNYEF